MKSGDSITVKNAYGPPVPRVLRCVRRPVCVVPFERPRCPPTADVNPLGVRSEFFSFNNKNALLYVTPIPACALHRTSLSSAQLPARWMCPVHLQPCVSGTTRRDEQRPVHSGHLDGQRMQPALWGHHSRFISCK